jgi:hypothetical protein
LVETSVLYVLPVFFLEYPQPPSLFDVEQEFEGMTGREVAVTEPPGLLVDLLGAVQYCDQRTPSAPPAYLDTSSRT